MARRGDDRDPVQVSCRKKVRETGMAVLYELADGEEKWFPKSVIEDVDEMDDGTAVIAVAAWFASKEGLDG